MSLPNPSRPGRDRARSPRRATPGERVAGALLALAMLAGLLAAAWVSPSGEGHGSHTQLGLAPCGWAVGFDVPCPTCGMTTSFSHAAHGNLLDSIRTQPAGAAGSVLAAMLLWGGLWTALAGTRLSAIARLGLNARVVWAGLALLALGWGYKALTW